jgi:hypothetical protein
MFIAKQNKKKAQSTYINDEKEKKRGIDQAHLDLFFCYKV